MSLEPSSQENLLSKRSDENHHAFFWWHYLQKQPYVTSSYRHTNSTNSEKHYCNHINFYRKGSLLTLTVDSVLADQDQIWHLDTDVAHIRKLNTLDKQPNEQTTNQKPNQIKPSHTQPTNKQTYKHTWHCITSHYTTLHFNYITLHFIDAHVYASINHLTLHDDKLYLHKYMYQYLHIIICTVCMHI